MKTIKCSCSNGLTLFFESCVCTACGRAVGVTEEETCAQSFNYEAESDTYWLDSKPTKLYKKCINNNHLHVCNGMVPLGAEDAQGQPIELCFYCRFTDIIPNLYIPEHIPLWAKMETAKRRALHTIKSLQLPLLSRHECVDTGLVFNFCVDRDAKDHFETPLDGEEQVFTGHDNGCITINLAEADDVARARTQLKLNEQYRTLLGHFRHELGHYYFDRLILPDVRKHQLCKEVFGDDEADYTLAMQRHYKDGPPADWQASFISEYATMHPWEDWAETWAHYMHVTEALETFADCGGIFRSAIKSVPIGNSGDNFNIQIDAWIQLSLALNSLNRSMGMPDAYPFVVTDTVRTKLNFIHRTIHKSL